MLVAHRAQLAATVVSPLSGRAMDLSTNAPGLQFYAGDDLNGSVAGKGAYLYPQYGGMALEAQATAHCPVSPCRRDNCCCCMHIMFGMIMACTALCMHAPFTESMENGPVQQATGHAVCRSALSDCAPVLSQVWPDYLHRPNFPQSILRAGQVYRRLWNLRFYNAT